MDTYSPFSSCKWTLIPLFLPTSEHLYPSPYKWTLIPLLFRWASVYCDHNSKCLEYASPFLLPMEYICYFACCRWYISAYYFRLPGRGEGRGGGGFQASRSEMLLLHYTRIMYTTIGSHPPSTLFPCPLPILFVCIMYSILLYKI